MNEFSPAEPQIAIASLGPGSASKYLLSIPAVSNRGRIIYGPRQFGVEDQGWVAWFLIAHALNRPVTIYGTGKQVRDLLFVDDLVDGYLAAITRIESVAGFALNIGGGPSNSISLLEFIEVVNEISGRPVQYTFADWRPGDQPVYISDISRSRSLLGWEPRVAVKDGIARLYEWVQENRSIFPS